MPILCSTPGKSSQRFAPACLSRRFKLITTGNPYVVLYIFRGHYSMYCRLWYPNPQSNCLALLLPMQTGPKTRGGLPERQPRFHRHADLRGSVLRLGGRAARTNATSGNSCLVLAAIGWIFNLWPPTTLATNQEEIYFLPRAQ